MPVKMAAGLVGAEPEHEVAGQCRERVGRVAGGRGVLHINVD